MTPARRELLELLAGLSEFAPNMRLGQLIANIAVIARGPVPEGVWDAEDEELVEAAREFLESYRNRAAHEEVAGKS